MAKYYLDGPVGTWDADVTYETVDHRFQPICDTMIIGVFQWEERTLQRGVKGKKKGKTQLRIKGKTSNLPTLFECVRWKVDLANLGRHDKRNHMWVDKDFLSYRELRRDLGTWKPEVLG